MEIYQFVGEVDKIMREIKELDKQAPDGFSAFLGIMRACVEELGNGYYFDLPKRKEKPK